MPSRLQTEHLCVVGRYCSGPRRRTLIYLRQSYQDERVHENSHVDPASSETKTLSDPKFATPTKMRGVALPLEPEVESKVTHDRPMMSLLYPEVSVGSGAYVPTLGKLLTCDQDSPKSVDFQSPLPLLVPKRRMLLLCGSTARR